MKKRATSGKAKQSKKQSFPRGWNEKRVGEVIDFYDRQTEDEELAEYEAARTIEGQSVMLVPTELVPDIRRLIARRRGA
jgi:hypothetical protein